MLKLLKSESLKNTTALNVLMLSSYLGEVNVRLFGFDAEDVSEQRESWWSRGEVWRILFDQKVHEQQSSDRDEQQSPQIEPQKEMIPPHRGAEQEHGPANAKKCYLPLFRARVNQLGGSPLSPPLSVCLCACKYGDAYFIIYNMSFIVRENNLWDMTSFKNISWFIIIIITRGSWWALVDRWGYCYWLLEC